jgi:3,4-dihydroxy 2-butanone 4-phosphate synthase/GTP cyclohydrolase II
MAGELDSLYRHLEASPVPADRPLVTLAFAQSLDGSIAAAPGRRTVLSSQPSLAMTHRLRAMHHGILVGIGTVLSDDPQLNVRYATGPHPRPVILDSRLRTPPKARLLSEDPFPWIAHHDGNDANSAPLEHAGAILLRLPSNVEGGLDLIAVLDELRLRGVRRLMVEGGSRVIRSFLRERLVDTLVLTIAPRLLGGLQPWIGFALAGDPPVLTTPAWAQVGPDMLVWSPLNWSVT